MLLEKLVPLVREDCVNTGRRVQPQDLLSKVTVDNYARKLLEHERKKDMREKGMEKQIKELTKRNFKNKSCLAFESYSQKINLNLVCVEIFLPTNADEIL